MTAAEPGAYDALEGRIGYSFADRTLCESALTHKSWLNERHGTARTDNERLEFLGDAVLALVGERPADEALPRPRRGRAVEDARRAGQRGGLAQAAEDIGLGEWIFLGRGEDQAGGRRKPSILSDALEALVGAVYLDGGFSAAHQVTERLFADALRDADSSARLDFKSRLQERSQALLQATPQYTVVAQEGPDHDKRFQVAISLGGREYGRALGRSKKEAEQSAAAKALDVLEPLGAARDVTPRRSTASESPPRCSRSAAACARRGTRRTWSAAACATCCSGARRPTSTSRPTRGPRRCSSSSDTTFAIPTGLQHGTVTVLTGDASPRRPVEVTTFRGEGAYLDGRPAVVGDLRVVAGRGSVAARLHDERRRVRPARGRSPIRSTGAAIWGAGSCAPSAIRWSASARTACAPCAPCARRRSSGSKSRPRRWPRSSRRSTSFARSRPSASATSCSSCWRRRGPRTASS